MIIGGRVYKEGKFWISECEGLDAMTQGKTKIEAVQMLASWIKDMLDKPKMKVDITERRGHLTIAANENAALISLMLKRERAKRGLSIRDVARRLKWKSHNAYAQYERGTIEPSVTQIEKIMEAIEPNKKLLVRFG